MVRIDAGLQEVMCMSACRYLEEELAQRYRDAAPATLTLLQRRCEDVAAELVAAEQQLASALTCLPCDAPVQLVDLASPKDVY